MSNQPSRKAYADYLDAKSLPTQKDESTGEHRYTVEAIAKLQMAILDALRSDAPLPDEMRQDLAFSFEYLCEGVAADLLTPIKRRGGREPPIAKKMQEAAIRYLRWVESGRIADAEPIATVSMSFQVEQRTVRNWRASWRDRPTPSLHDDYGPEHVTMFMKAIGGQYRRFIPKPAKGPKRW
jgi:hypothetical protein